MASSVFHHEKLKILIVAAIAISVAAAADEDCSKLESVDDTCKATQFPDLCYNSLFPLIGANAEPQVIFKRSAEVAKDEASKASAYFAVDGELIKILVARMPDNNLAFSAVEDCRSFFSLALYDFDRSLSSTDLKSKATRDDIRAGLGAVDADLEACKDGFDDVS